MHLTRPLIGSYGYFTISPRRETSTSLLPALPLTRRCLTPSRIFTLHQTKNRDSKKNNYFNYILVDQ